VAGKPHKILPHGELEPLAPNLWLVTGSLPFPLKRNMTIVRLPDGTLLLHSVVALTDEGMAKLEALGRPSVLIVPFPGHRKDAPFFKARYPEARVICPAAARAKVEEVVEVDAACEEALPALGVRVHPVPGFRHGELAYELDLPAGGKALVMGDSVGNGDYQKTIGGWFFANVTGGIKGRLGVARIMRVGMMNDKAAARAGLRALAELPGLTVLTVAHGRPILEAVSEALREAAASF
jgi:hypothetical protein